MLRITEQQLYGLIAESIHRVLSEAKATADEVYQKYYSDVDRNLFDAVLKADPTTKNGYTGKYAKWLLNLARHGKWKAGDVPETRTTLERFMRTWKNLEKKDIQQYDSVGELYDAVMQSEPQKTRKETKAEADKVYEDSDWTVIVPKTEEAAKLYGKGTKWCTAAEKNNMFGYYNEDGPLYILISKKDGSKFQIHFPTEQYMDAQDEPFGDMNDIAKHGNVKGLTNFLKSQTNRPNFQLFPDERTLRNLSDYVDGFIEDWDEIDVDDIIKNFTPQYSVTDIFNTFLERIQPYHLFIIDSKINDDYTIVHEQPYGYNILWLTMNDTYELTSQEWFTKIYPPRENTNILKVQIGDKYNYVTLKGQLLLPQNVEDAKDFSDGIAIYYSNNGYEPCFLYPDGRQINTHLIDCQVSPFKFGNPYTLAITTQADRANLIDREGNLRFEKWIDIKGIRNGFSHGWGVLTVDGKDIFLNARDGKVETH